MTASVTRYHFHMFVTLSSNRNFERRLGSSQINKTFSVRYVIEKAMVWEGEYAGKIGRAIPVSHDESSLTLKDGTQLRVMNRQLILPSKKDFTKKEIEKQNKFLAFLETLLYTDNDNPKYWKNRCMRILKYFGIDTKPMM